MSTINLTPIYRSRIGFNRLAAILDSTLSADKDKLASDCPPYNIVATAENCYAISLNVAGFSRDEIDIQIENGVLTINGKKNNSEDNKKSLYQGIALRPFERKFNLNDYVEVKDAEMSDGLLTINLVKEIPQAMKPKKIAINDPTNIMENKSVTNKAA